MNPASILIIEDDAQILSTFNTILSAEGYETATADSGEKGLALLEQTAFDLILSDIVMGQVDGFQILDAVKKISPDTAVILMTGYGFLEMAIEAVRRDAYDFIIKPFNDDELIIRIKRALEKKWLKEKAHQSELCQKTIETLGAVAHELNNPLMAIMGNAELLLMEITPDNPVYKQLKTIEQSAQKMTEIIKRMKEIRGIETKLYTKDSKILDIQKSSGFMPAEEKTILIVDDDEGILRAFSRFFTIQEYHADTANSGSKALEMIETKIYSIVLLDICMPEMDGYETLKRMNNYYTEKNIQIPATIMITGYGVDDILEKCKKTGAFATLEKPVKLGKLLETVRQAEDFAKR